MSEKWVTVEGVLSALETYNEIKNSEKTMSVARLVVHSAAWANNENDALEVLYAEMAAKKDQLSSLSIKYTKKLSVAYFCRATAIEILLKFEKLNDFTTDLSSELKLAKDAILKLTGCKYPGWQTALKVITDNSTEDK